jgi:hypothetical protein
MHQLAKNKKEYDGHLLHKGRGGGLTQGHNEDNRPDAQARSIEAAQIGKHRPVFPGATGGVVSEMKHPLDPGHFGKPDSPMRREQRPGACEATGGDQPKRTNGGTVAKPTAQRKTDDQLDRFHGALASWIRALRAELRGGRGR